MVGVVLIVLHEVSPSPTALVGTTKLCANKSYSKRLEREGWVYKETFPLKKRILSTTVW